MSVCDGRVINQLDLYTQPNEYQILYASYNLSTNQTLIGVGFLVSHNFDSSNFNNVLVLTFLACIL